MRSLYPFLNNPFHFSLSGTSAGCLMLRLAKMPGSLHAPQNLVVLRRFALNDLNREATDKRSLKQKSKQAAMNDDYMLKVLAAALPDKAETSSSET